MIFMENSKYNNKIMNIISMMSLFLFAFIPTSINNNRFGLPFLLFVWALSLVMTIVVGINNKIDFKRMIIGMIVINLYMLIVTFYAQTIYDNYHVSLARIAPLVMLFFASYIKIVKFPSYRLMKYLLNIFCICCIIINIGILLKISFITDFINNYYNQYYDLASFYSVTYYHKPVMTFGVHTYASFFYFIAFILCFYTYQKTEKKIYLFYALSLCIFCLFLVSTTAIIYFICMVMFLIFNISKKLTKNKMACLFIGFFAILVLIVNNYSMLSERLIDNFTSGESGFISRYSGDSVFEENFKIITSSIGIGYNIIDDLEISYSDSGYIVYLTMGSVILMAFVYYRVYMFISKNVPSQYRSILLFTIFSFEVALPATFNYRFIYTMFFVICYLNALAYSEKNVENSK